MRSLPALAAVSVAATLVLAGCGSAAENTAGGEDAGGAFPVTIQHAFGETTIESKPERVATVAWANQEVALALGIVPVGFPAVTWGDDDGDGVLPWVEERLGELGAETPVLFDEADGIDFEAVADTQPDVILAAYSGLTQEEYDTLSQIAPVVAYPELAWGTSMQDMIRLNGEALGLAEEGEALIADLDQQIDESLAQYPQLEGKSVMFSWFDLSGDLSQVGFYTTHDTRPGFLASIGFEMPAIVADRSAASESFFETISAEQADLFADVDIIVAYDAADGSGLSAAQADPLLSRIPAIATGAVASLEDSSPLAASANPSPLSVGWGIDEYFALLAAAADKADQAS
jgi:ABC-type Fe3+-hydroxamate transport system substrate-binding protein